MKGLVGRRSNGREMVFECHYGTLCHAAKGVL